jgi:hypothetical protein
MVESMRAGSVVHRGIAIRENLLCTPIEPPPPDVMPTVLPPAEGTTARDRFKAHETGTCAGCHAQMDPIGLAFENFDGLGRYRTMDGGVLIDATGARDGGGSAGTFDGIVELGRSSRRAARWPIAWRTSGSAALGRSNRPTTPAA